jgi:predicted nucleotidyltransferase
VTQLESRLRRVVVELAEAGVDCALVGGPAVSVRTEPRFTRDADLVVAVAGDPEAEALIRQLRADGYQLQALVEQESFGRIATVRLGVSDEPETAVVDLLFASSGIEVDVVRDADLIEVLPGLTMRVARTGHLIALKVLSRDDVRRPQDVIDLRALLRVAPPDEVARARGAIGDITSRGYHRGRDLAAALEQLLADASRVNQF